MVKYQEPKYEVTIMETSDIIAASNTIAQVEVEKDENGVETGKGFIYVGADDLFR